MAHGSKMISRVLGEADQAIGLARHFAPLVAASQPQNEGNLAPALGVYLESIAARITVLRERLSAGHLNRSILRAETLLQHDTMRAKAVRVRAVLFEVRFQLDRIYGKAKVRPISRAAVTCSASLSLSSNGSARSSWS